MKNGFPAYRRALWAALAIALLMLPSATLEARPDKRAAAAEAELIQLEHDYAKALIKKDTAFLQRYFAPDWRGGNWMGFATKSTILNLLNDRGYVVSAMRLRDLRVQIVGDVGIVQGTDEETSAINGRDTSGVWGFTDIFARRAGRWVAIASHTTKIERAKR